VNTKNADSLTEVQAAPAELHPAFLLPNP
jgi:hypothetical protein